MNEENNKLRTDLLKKARDMEDKTEDCYSAEFFLLQQVACTSSDLVKARYWDDFRDACGGMDKLTAAHETSVRAWEQWLNEGDDSE